MATSGVSHQNIFPETENQGQEPDLPGVDMHDLDDVAADESEQVDEDADLYDSDRPLTTSA